MRCDDVCARFSEKIDGELDEALATAIDLHVSACQPCRERLAAFARAVGALPTLPRHPVPATFADEALARLDTEAVDATERFARSSAANAWWRVAAAVLVIAVIVAGFEWRWSHRFNGIASQHEADRRDFRSLLAEQAQRHERILTEFARQREEFAAHRRSFDGIRERLDAIEAHPDTAGDSAAQLTALEHRIEQLREELARATSGEQLSAAVSRLDRLEALWQSAKQQLEQIEVATRERLAALESRLSMAGSPAADVVTEREPEADAVRITADSTGALRLEFDRGDARAIDRLLELFAVGDVEYRHLALAQLDELLAARVGVTDDARRGGLGIRGVFDRMSTETTDSDASAEFRVRRYRDWWQHHRDSWESTTD